METDWVRVEWVLERQSTRDGEDGEQIYSEISAVHRGQPAVLLFDLVHLIFPALRAPRYSGTRSMWSYPIAIKLFEPFPVSGSFFHVPPARIEAGSAPKRRAFGQDGPNDMSILSLRPSPDSGRQGHIN